MNHLKNPSSPQTSSSRLGARLACGVLLLAALLLPSAETRAANTVITNISANLLDSGSWSPGPAVPTAANDAVFDVNFWNSTFYLGFDTGYGNLTVGSINFLNTSGASLQDFTGDVGSEQDSVLVLAGGTGNSVPGANVSDLLYITNGVNVYIHGENGLGWPSLLRINLATNGNFNIAPGATLLLSGEVSGTGFGLNKTGAGALTVMGNLSFTGGFTNTAGFYTNSGLSTYTGPTVFKGNATNYFNSIASVGAGASSLGAPTDTNNGVLHFVGGTLRYIGAGDCTSDRLINWSGGGAFFNDSGTGKLILTGGITNSGQICSFRGNGTNVVTGLINIGAGAVTRTDGGLLVLTNQLHPFTGNISISTGKFFIDTIANGGVACSIGKGTGFSLGQLNGPPDGTLQLAVTNGSTCDRAISITSWQSANGPIIENTLAGTTVTFSGNITSTATNLVAAPSFTLTGAGNGVLSGVFGANTNTLVAFTLVKSGLGTWTISGLNTNRGLVTVNAGTLLINGDSSQATNTVTVANNASFGGKGTNGGNVVVNSGGKLVPGGLNTVGTLTLTNSLTLNGGTLYFDIGNVAGTGDQVVVGNALNVNGANNIVLNFPSGPAPAGTYTLITNISKTGIGSFALQGSYPNANLVLNPNNVQLVVTGSGTVATNLTWVGNVSGTWDTSTGNWATNGVTGAMFANGSSVFFDDTLVANPVVSSTGPVSPSTVNFNNSLTNYTIAAAIGGTGTTLTKNGTAVTAITGTNTYSGNTLVNAGNLVVSNGGAIYSPSATLNIGSGSIFATNTLSVGGAITVQTLLATNVVCGAVTNSIFNFTGGTLTTSNNNGLAANILLASNANFFVNGNWTMDGGTNIFSNVATNGNPTAYVQVGSINNNRQVTVNSNAVLWLAIPANSIVTNVLNLQIGAGNATNNVLTVNGGILIVTNKANFTAGSIQVGTAAGSTGNQLIITNGGQVFSRADGSTGPNVGQVGPNGSFNSLLVAGTNGAGQKSVWNLGLDRLIVGAGNPAYSNNTVVVSSGGQITNANILIWGFNNSVTVTNGGQIYSDGLTVGRNGYGNSSLYVGGADSAGNKALVNSYRGGDNLIVGGGQGSAQPAGANPGTNCFVMIDANGVVTNVNQVFVAGGTQSNDVFCVGNRIVITNGGQLFSRSASFIGGNTNCDNNYVAVGGGGTNQSLWNLNNQTLTIGVRTVTGGLVPATGNYLTLFTNGVVTNMSSVVLGGTNSLLNFNGGGLAAGGNGNLIITNASTINATNYVQAGGAVIDSVGFTITNVLPLIQDASSTGGGLTKLGVGTLVLASGNTYTGNTVVGAGRLLWATGGSSANSAVTVLSGATNTVQIVAAAGQWTCVGLTNSNGSALDINFDTNSLSLITAPIQVTGNLDFNSANLVVRGSAALPVGTYPLIKYGSVSGTLTPATITLPFGVGGSLNNNTGTKTVELIVTSGVYWAVGNGNWDTATQNWKDTAAAGITNALYANPKPVILDDSAGGTGTLLVTNTVAVAPTAVTVNVTNKNYALYGGSAIGGGTFTKSGPGTLTLSNTVALGSASFMIAGGTVLLPDGGTDRIGNAIPFTLAGGTLALAGTVSETLGVLTVGGPAANAIDFGTGAGNLTFANSSAALWSGAIQILNWSGSTNGGGTDRLFFGNSAAGLTAGQVALIGFKNPAGTNGNFAAVILSTGEVVPNLNQIYSDQWKPTATGTYDWNLAANWVGGANYPGGLDAVANVTTNIAGAQTINLNEAITLGTLNLGDNASTFFNTTIVSNTAAGALTFDASSGTALLLRPTNNTASADAINANVTLNKPLLVFLQASGNAVDSITVGGAVSGTGGITLAATNYNATTADNLQLLDLLNTNSSFSGPVTVANGVLGFRGSVLSGQNSALGNSTGAIRISSSLSGTNNINGQYNNSAMLRLKALDDTSNYVINRDLDFSSDSNYVNSTHSGRARFEFAGNGDAGTNFNTVTLGGVVTLANSNRNTCFLATGQGMTIYFTNNIQGGLGVPNLSLGMSTAPSANPGLTDGPVGGTYRFSDYPRTFTNAPVVTIGTVIIEGNVPATGNSPIGVGTGQLQLTDGNGGSILQFRGETARRAVFLATPGATNARGATFGNGSTGTTYGGTNNVNVYNSDQIGGVNTSGTVTWAGPITFSSPNVGSNGTPNYITVAHNLALLAATGGTVSFTGVISDTPTNTASTNNLVTRVTVNQVRNHPNLDTNADYVIDTTVANQLVGTPTAGTVILGVGNTYEGGTEVLGGTLLVTNLTGSGTGIGDVMVTNGAALGGSGRIAGRVIFAPGTFMTNTAGSTLITSNTVTLNGNTIYVGALTPLGAGDYLLLTNTVGGISGSFATVTIGGAGLASGMTTNFVSTASSVTLHVVAATTLQLVSSANPSTFSSNVTFTATVQTSLGTATAATGNIVFKVDGTPVTTNAVVSGAAAYATSTLALGSHPVVAEYSGAANYLPSTNNSLSQVVNAAQTLPATGTNITFTPIVGNTFDLTWPANYIGWELRSNSVDVTLPSYWFVVPGSTTTNKVTITINPSLPNVFYRMQHP